MPVLKAGAEATTLSNVDPRFSLFTREGVKNISGVATELGKQQDIALATTGLETAGKLIPELHKQVKIGQLDSQIGNYAKVAREDQQDIDFWEEEVNNLSSEKNRLRKENQTLGAANIASYNENLKSLQQIENSHVQAVDKLRQAYKQGAISSKEFEINVRSLTREAVSRNPGYTNELISHARDVSWLAGIRDIQDPTKSLMKAEQDMERRDTEILSKQLWNVHIDHTQYDLQDPIKREQLQQELSVRTANKRKAVDLTQTSQAIKASKDYTSPQRKAEGYNALSGVMNNLNDVIYDHYNTTQNLDASQRVQEELRLRSNLSGEANLLRTNLASLGIPATEINSHIKALENHADTMIKLVNNITSGKASLDELKTKVAIGNESFNASLMEEGYSPKVFDHLRKLPITTQRDILESKGMKDYVKGYGAAIYSANTRATGGFYSDRNIDKEKPDAAVAIQNAIVAEDTDSVDALSKIYSDHISKDTTNLDGKTRMSAAYHITDTLANIPITSKFNFDPTTRNNLRDVIQYNTETSGRFFRREVADMQERGLQVTTSFNDGLIHFSVTKDGEVSPEQGKLNTKYGNAFNLGIKAYARLYKNTWKDTAEEILQRWGNQWYYNVQGGELQDLVPLQEQGSRGQNPNNPGNIKVPGENKFKDFGSPEAGIKAIKNQLLRYHSGESKAAGIGNRLITPEQMLNVYHNPKEKGSINQEQYLKNIAQHSGLSLEELRQPIDPQDKDTWNDLIYGIIKAESKNTLTRRDIRLALGEE